MKKYLFASSLVLLSISCAKQNAADSALTVSPETAVVETAAAAVGDVSDEQANENYAVLQSSNSMSKYALVQSLIFPSAHASGFCGRAVAANCSQGMREADYSDCNPTLNTSLDGFVRLTYSQSACTLSSTGDTVTRTYDLTLSGPHGGVATVSSASASDYRGTNYGGGGVLTKTASGYSVDVLGKHIALNFRSIPLYSVSIRTLSTLQLTGTLSRASRVWSSGQLEVNHNLAGFTAVFQPSNLQWTSGCCYPVSGSLSVQYSGSRTGSATVTFNGCGTANYSDGVQQKTIALNYCE
jgi:hypothetical protein